MFARSFATVAVLVHAVVGNLCMMPMAYAQGGVMQHEEHRAMGMTPMAPEPCEHCATMELDNDDRSQQQSSCAGHCFSQVQSSTAASTTTFDAPHVVTSSPVPITIVFVPHTTSVVLPPATAPPLSVHIDSIVLRL